MKHLNILCASVSMLLATSAVAGEASADLLVKGSITPGGACSLTTPGQLSFGTINRGELNQDPSQPTKLDQKEVPVEVHCPYSSRFALTVREAAGQDPTSNEIFPIHDDNGGDRVGKLYLRFISHSVRIDTVQGYATGSSTEGDLEHATWGPSTPFRENLPIRNGRWGVGFVTSPGSTEVPGNIKDLTVRVIAEPVINPVNDLNLSDQIGFSSDLGLEISYF